MKEGLVTLPEGIVILQEEQTAGGRLVSLKNLSLSEIPDDQAKNINTAIKYIQKHSDIPSSGGYYSYPNPQTGDFPSSTNYRVVRAGSKTAMVPLKS